MQRMGLSHKLLKQYPTEIAEDLTEEGVEACRCSAVDDAVIPCQR